MVKCVVWDLDNTLWEGILSEKDDVILRDGMIKILDRFSEKGVIHSICSRNDKGAALKKLEEFGIEKYFVLPQISWESKSDGIRTISNSLHIKYKDIVFVDDSNFERDEVKSVFKEINTIDSSDLEKLEEIVNELECKNSTECKQRINMYKVEEKRIIDLENYDGTKEQFFKECNIRIHIKEAQVDDLERLKELIDRTNQLNSTGMRYSEEEIINMISSNEYDVYVGDVEDKYGSYGRSALVVCRRNDTFKTYEIYLLIVSCRLMGRSIPQALLSFCYDVAKNKSYRKIACFYKDTGVNRQIILLYTMNGFKLIDTSEDISRYEKDIDAGDIDIPKWLDITIE